MTSAQTIVSRQLDINKQPAVVTFGIFEGGQRFNIIPDKVELQGTVRAFDEDMRKQALASLKNIAEHVAAANGATVDTEIPTASNSNPVNYNDPALTERVRASLVKALGAGNVSEAPRWTAAEDFPQLGLSVPAPSVYFLVGATAAGTGSCNGADQSFAEVLPRRRCAHGRYAGDVAGGARLPRLSGEMTNPTPQPDLSSPIMPAVRSAVEAIGEDRVG